MNLGTGQGLSVLQMIAAFEAASGRTIPYVIAPRRGGDIDKFWADLQRARSSGLAGASGVDAMCQSVWNWQTQNPDGYGLSADPSK